MGVVYKELKCSKKVLIFTLYGGDESNVPTTYITYRQCFEKVQALQDRSGTSSSISRTSRSSSWTCFKVVLAGFSGFYGGLGVSDNVLIKSL